jgi:pyruvate/2-oxoglutarate dehydrogenase complex dihydrolipoamide acyltransferase (E2) component
LIPVTYGTDTVPGLVLNVLAAAGQPKTLLVQVLWGHGCSGISGLLLNDQPLPAGHQVHGHYLGDQTVADTALVAAFAAQGVTYIDTLQGFAYSVLAIPVASFDGQLSLTALIQGRRVYDPRKDSTAGGSGPQRLADPATWAPSDNPSLCLADWVASPVYGAGRAVDWASVPAAANANDELIGSPAEKRRVLGVTLAYAASVPQVGDALRAYAGCWLVPSSAGYRLVPDRDGPASASYSHELGQIAAMEPLTLRDLGNSPTAVEVVYTDTSQVPWRDAAVEARLPGAGETLPWRLTSVRMPGIQRGSQALREATERLNKLSLSDLSTTLEVFDGGLAHDVGDLVEVSHPLGLNAKPMRVAGIEAAGPGRWRLSVVEHDPAAYSDSVQTVPTYADTSRVLVGDEITLAGLGYTGALNATAGAALNNDPGCTSAALWPEVGAGFSIVTIGDGIAGGTAWRKGAAGGSSYTLSNRVAVDRAKAYRAKWWARKSPGADGEMYAAVALQNAAGQEITGSGTLWYYAASGVVPGDAWTEYVGTFGAGTARPIPEAARTMSVGAFLGYSTTTGYHEMQGVRLEEVTDLLAASAAAAADATAKANAAQAAAVSAAAAAAQAAADLAEVEAKAYADGIVSAEEARAIADATAKANAAQAAATAFAAADATAKANAAALTAEWSGVSGVSVTTGQIAPGAATSVTVDNHDFAGATYGTATARTVVVTPAVDCTIEFTASIVAQNVVGDAGNQLGWWVTPAGGAELALGGAGVSTSAKQQISSATAFSATGGVALTFAIKTVRPGGNPNIGLFQSQMRITQIKR